MNRRSLRAVAIGVGLGVVWMLGVALAPGRNPRAIDWQFTQRVAGIPVADAQGNPMSSPFLGGFDVPRPQLVDINGDGKLDLFVQERPGAIMYFERIGQDWQWRTDKYQDIDPGEWYRFVDVDRDGDADLIAEMLTGYIRIYRNVGTKNAAKFEAMGDTVRDVDGQPIVADRQNIINAVDIDCNNKLDLFVGRVQGVVDHYEQEGSSPDGSPRFRLMEVGWQGIEVLGPEATGGAIVRTDTIDEAGSNSESEPREHGPLVTSRAATAISAMRNARRHGANTLTFADVEGRGVLDLYWGDFFEEGLLRFENTGSCAQPNLTGRPARFPETKPILTSGYNAPTFGDVDGDGNVDLVVGAIGGAFGPFRTSVENMLYVQQAPKGTWSVKTRRLINTIDVGTESTPALADINGDGLLDLIVGGKISPSDQGSGTVMWYANAGTAKEPAFRERGPLPIRGQFSYVPTVVDLNGDSLPDIVVGTFNDRIQLYRNTGTRTAPAFTMADSALVTITRGTNTTPSFGDLNGDGLVDLVIGEGSGTINLYRNSGTKISPKFELVSDNFQSIKVGRRSAPSLYDMDGDGKLDMLIANAEGDVQLWKNVGAAGEFKFERDASFKVKSYSDAVVAAGDLHGTGRVDLLVGTTSGGLRWFERVH